VKTPDFAKRLPKPIQRFTTKGVYDLGKKTHLSFVTQGSGHGGSHPHLANEFANALASKSASPSRMPRNPPTGPAWASAPISRRWRAARS
jgi:hypothetical protein